MVAEADCLPVSSLLPQILGREKWTKISLTSLLSRICPPPHPQKVTSCYSSLSSAGVPSHLSERKQNTVCFITAIALAKERRPCPATQAQAFVLIFQWIRTNTGGYLCLYLAFKPNAMKALPAIDGSEHQLHCSREARGQVQSSAPNPSCSVKGGFVTSQAFLPATCCSGSCGQQVLGQEQGWACHLPFSVGIETLLKVMERLQYQCFR